MDRMEKLARSSELPDAIVPAFYLNLSPSLMPQRPGGPKLSVRSAFSSRYPLCQPLLPMTALHGLILTEYVNPHIFTHALHPNMGSPEAVVCPKLEELVLVPRVDGEETNPTSRLSWKWRQRGHREGRNSGLFGLLMNRV